MKTDTEKHLHILSRNVESIIAKEEFLKKVKSGKKLQIKHGVDATSPFLHLGHAVNFWKLREFQELGHRVIFLIGDFTTNIGDPTGKNKTRPELPQKTIKENEAKYLEQASKILINKPNLLEVRRNSEWYKKMKLEEFLFLLKKITHAQLIERNMFQERIKKQNDIYMHELIYPILQGYDSVVLKSDLTVIGTDQLFNEMIGRKFQQMLGQDQQVIITTPITPGLDGKEKMSKSLNNYIAILDKPNDKFGKAMSLPDGFIFDYFIVHTNLDVSEIEKCKKLKPYDAKKRLAYEIVKRYHGINIAKTAQENFEKIFSRKEIPTETRVYRIKKGETLVDFLASNRIVSSKAEAKRMIFGGAIDFDCKKISYPGEKIKHSGTIKVGKHIFVKVELIK